MDLGSKSFRIVAVPPAVLHVSSWRIFIPRALGSIRSALGRRGSDQSRPMSLAALPCRLDVVPARPACLALAPSSYPHGVILRPTPASMDHTQLLRTRRPLLCQIRLRRGLLARQQSPGEGHHHPSASPYEELSRVHVARPELRACVQPPETTRSLGLHPRQSQNLPQALL